jgi:hypothetical protein
MQPWLDLQFALVEMESAGMLAGTHKQANWDSMVSHKAPKELRLALKLANAASLLASSKAQYNFEKIVSHPNLHLLNKMLRMLTDYGLLTGSYAEINYNAVVNFECPDILIDALNELIKNGLLSGLNTQFNFFSMFFIVSSEAMVYVSKKVIPTDDGSLNHAVLEYMQSIEDDIREQMLQFIIQHIATPEQGRKELADYIYNKAALFVTQDKQVIFDKITLSKDPALLISIVSLVNQAGLFACDKAQYNFERIVGHPKLDVLYDQLLTMTEYGLLTGIHAQANYQALVNLKYPEISMLLEKLVSKGLLLGVDAQSAFSSMIDVASLDIVIRLLDGLCPTDEAEQNPVVVDCLMPIATIISQQMFQTMLLMMTPQTANSVEALQALSNCIDNEAGLFVGYNKQAIFNAITLHKDPVALIAVLNMAYKAGLLASRYAQYNFDSIVIHRELSTLHEALTIMTEYGLLTGIYAEANYHALVNLKYPELLSMFLTQVIPNALSLGVSAQFAFASIICVVNLDIVIRAWDGIYLTNEAVQNPALIDYLESIMQISCQHMLQAIRSLMTQQISTVEDALQVLAGHIYNEAGLFLEPNKQITFDAISRHQTPNLLLSVLNKAHRLGLLTGENAQNNINRIASHHYQLQSLYSVLSYMHTCDMAKVDYDAVMELDCIGLLDYVLKGFIQKELLLGVTKQRTIHSLIHFIASIISSSAWENLNPSESAVKNPVLRPKLEAIIDNLYEKILQVSIKDRSTKGQLEIIHHIRQVTPFVNEPEKYHGVFFRPLPFNEQKSSVGLSQPRLYR